MTLDPARFPHAAKYLSELPQGMNSYPQCECRVGLVHEALAHYPKTVEALKELPKFRHLLELMDRPADEWTSDVHANVLRLMGRDLDFKDHAAFLQWNYDMAMNIYKQPLYRMLMFILSPTLMVIGAQKRWATFRKGTVLVSGRGVERPEVALTFPEKLYNKPLLEGFGEVFRAALIAAGAKEVRWSILDQTDTSARFCLLWK